MDFCHIFEKLLEKLYNKILGCIFLHEIINSKEWNGNIPFLLTFNAVNAEIYIMVSADVLLFDNSNIFINFPINYIILYYEKIVKFIRDNIKIQNL